MPATPHPADAARDNPIERRERARYRTWRRVISALCGIGVLAHLGCAGMVVDEILEHPDAGGFLTGLLSILGIMLSHAVGLVVNLLLLPPVIATTFAEERERGLDVQLVLAPYARADLIRGKLGPRLRPFLWHAFAHAAITPLAVLGYEIWMVHNDQALGLPPLGAIASALGIAASFAAAAACSLWIGLKVAQPGRAIAAAYLALLVGGFLCAGSAVGVGVVTEELTAGTIPEEIGALVALGFSLFVSGGLLVAAWAVWRRCVAGFDELLLVSFQA